MLFLVVLHVLGMLSEYTGQVEARRVEHKESCRPEWEQVHHSCYKLPSNDLVSRAEAEKICQVHNAELLSIDTPADDAILNTLLARNGTTIIWARPDASSSKHLRNSSDVVCFALNVFSGNLVLSPCHDYLPYVCEISLSDGSTAARNRWIANQENVKTNPLSARSNVLTLTGGILAGIIVLTLMWIAIGIGIVVYVRQRRLNASFNAQWMAAERAYVDQKEEHANLNPGENMKQ